MNAGERVNDYPPIAGAIFDPADLLELAGGDQEFVDEMVDVFVGMAPEYLDNLRRSMNSGWREAAHKLKGTARNVGAFRLGDWAEYAEKLTDKTDGGVERRAAYERIEEEMADFLVYVESERNRR